MDEEMKQQLEGFWNEIDVNNDGNLDKKEVVAFFRKMMTESGKGEAEEGIKKGGDAAWTAFLAMDANGDGKISKDEVFAYLAEHGEPNLPMPEDY